MNIKAFASGWVCPNGEPQTPYEIGMVDYLSRFGAALLDAAQPGVQRTKPDVREDDEENRYYWDNWQDAQMPE